MLPEAEEEEQRPVKDTVKAQGDTVVPKALEDTVMPKALEDTTVAKALDYTVMPKAQEDTTLKATDLTASYYCTLEQHATSRKSQPCGRTSLDTLGEREREKGLLSVM